MQEYMLAWIAWYYGNAPYPTEIQNKLPYSEAMKAIELTSKIKEIIGEPINNKK
jgi:hypothetical protein